MKQYVLDEPVAAAPPPVEPRARSLTEPGWWGWLLLAIPLEAVALAILYVALNGIPGSSPDAPSRGVAYVASFSFPREAQAARAPPADRERIASSVSSTRHCAAPSTAGYGVATCDTERPGE